MAKQNTRDIATKNDPICLEKAARTKTTYQMQNKIEDSRSKVVSTLDYLTVEGISARISVILHVYIHGCATHGQQAIEALIKGYFDGSDEGDDDM